MKKRDFIKKMGSVSFAAAASKFYLNHFFSSPSAIPKFHNALFFDLQDNNTIQCLLCPHRCLLTENMVGKCKARANKEGNLIALAYGRSSFSNLDPIEKKPFFHFLPGSKIFSVGSWGCNFSCLFCQNHIISQTIDGFSLESELPPDQIILQMKNENHTILAFTYNEPLVNFEYLYDSMVLAKSLGYRTALVSNGYIESEPLEMIIPYLDAANIDFKFLSEDLMQKFCSASVNPVLSTLKRLNNSDVHLEITTLIIPEIHGGISEANRQFHWLIENGFADVPLHLNRFLPHYRMDSYRQGDPDEVLQLRILAQNVGIHYVYAGNLGADYENNTLCNVCNEVLIKRRGYLSHSTPSFDDNGFCCQCGNKINGIWQL